MGFKMGDVEHTCDHGCKSLLEHFRVMGADNIIDEFENNFENYIDGLSLLIVMGGIEKIKPVIQSLVNAYHERKEGCSPIQPHYNTLMMLVKITGASLKHSGENESQKIMETGLGLAR